MDRRLRCYMPCLVEIGSLDKEIFEGFLAYMGVAAILSCDHVVVNKPFPPIQWDYASNLALIGQAVSEEMFEIVNVDDRRTDAGPGVCYKLAYEPSAQMSLTKSCWMAK